MIARNKIAGALYGVALGDAMGRPTEFMYDIRNIHNKYGRSGVMLLPWPALITDDTQMTLAVSTAMWRARSITPREMVRTLRQEYIRWAKFDPRRAPGITCMTAIGKMDAKPWLHWADATITGSKGCGANMRVVPTAFVRNVDTALGLSQLQAAMTHGHPTALAATELTALAVRLAAMDMPMEKLVDRLLAHAVVRARTGHYRDEWLGQLHRRWGTPADVAMTFGWKECVRALVKLTKLQAIPRKRRPMDICAALGRGGWIAEEALALGLYYAIEYADDPALAISEAARTSGDSDSIASIAGAIVGAHLGEQAWPSDWCTYIERREEIEWAIDVAEVSNR